MASACRIFMCQILLQAQMSWAKTSVNLSEEWKKPENKNRLCQKDWEGRFTRKGREEHYGNKDSFNVDADSKLILDYETSHAAMHTSQMIPHLIDETGNIV